MARQQLGVAPSAAPDTATKGYVDAQSTSYGKTLMAAADPATARAVLKLPPIVHAADTITADGVTDVSAALSVLISGIPDGGVLQLAAGTYYTPSLRLAAITHDIVIRGVPGKTKILGNGGRSANLYGDTGARADVMLNIMSGGSLRIQDIIFENAGIPVGVDHLAEAGDIEIFNCQFTGCAGVLLPTGTSAQFLTGMQAGKTLAFRNLRVRDCDIRSCELGVVAWVYGGWESVSISGCNFNNVGDYAIYIGNEGGVSGAVARDNTAFQKLQPGVHIHDNTIKTVRRTAYTQDLAAEAVNGIAVWGYGVNIHDNYIEDVDNPDKWDDCEGIYVKARYFDIHDNVLINAGGAEAAINMKGGGWQASTTLDASMNGLTLPQATITVASTAGFPAKYEDGGYQGVMIQTSLGWQRVNFTGVSGNTLTGCTGGTGTLATGGVVSGEAHADGYLSAPGHPGSCRNNTIVFTRTDRVSNGINVGVPYTTIIGNTIKGANGRAVGQLYSCHHCVLSDNTVIDHHGGNVFNLGASDWVVHNNNVINLDGAYVPSETVYRVFWVAVSANSSISNIVIRDNYIFSPLSSGAVSAAAAKTRAVSISGNTSSDSFADFVTVRDNVARNIGNGLVVSSTVGVTRLIDVGNDWRNLDGSSVSDSTSAATSITLQKRQNELVTLNETQTLTAKTLTAPVLNSPKIDTFYDVNNKAILNITPIASAVNYLTLANNVTGGSPRFTVAGTDTNIDLTLIPKGTGAVRIYADTGKTPTVLAAGNDTNHNLNLVPKGSTGRVQANGIEVCRRTVQTVTSSTTLGADGDYVVFVGSGGAPTLPTAVGNTGRYSVKNTHTADRTILTTSSQTIDGVVSLTLVPGESIDLVSDGSNWRII